LTPCGQTSSHSDITFVNGALNIIRAPLSITADSAIPTLRSADLSKTYNGQVYSGFTARYYGFVNSETPASLSGTLSFSGAGTTAIAGADVCAVAPGAQRMSTYALTFVNGALNINRAPLSITADSD